MKREELDAVGEATKRRNPHLFTNGNQSQSLTMVNEADLHNDIMDYCDKMGWLYFHGAMCKRTHRTEGEPDFIILIPEQELYLIEAKTFILRNPRIVLIECKSKTGKVTKEQSAVIAHAAKLGHTIHVVRSIAEFLEATKV